MMKILFVAVSNNPFVATQGSSQRSNLLLNALTKIADVDVISFCSEKEPSKKYSIVHQENYKMPNRDGRFTKFRRLLTPWDINTIFHIDQHKEKIIDAIIAENHYDYVAIRYIPAAIECGLWKYSDKLIIDIDDSPCARALADADAAKSLRNKLYLLAYAKIMQGVVVKVVRKSKYAFVSNPDDAKNNSAIVLPNVPFYTAHEPDLTKEQNGRMLFVGDLGYRANQEGISHFLEAIYLKVKQVLPFVELHIVGRLWNEELKKIWESYDGVTVTGFVPSLINEYQEAQVSIIPIYHGAGTCIKVVETMQMRKACVTTPTGFRGYNKVFVSGEDCVVAETDEEFIFELVEMLQNPEKRYKMEQNAFEKQQKYYSKERFNNIVVNTIR